jgi:sporulation protein YtfJ
MKEHPINDLLNISLDSVIRMVDTSKIVGTPIDLGNNRFIIPISKVSFGFGAGGSEFTNASPDKRKTFFNSEVSEEIFPFGGGSGGGISINPSSFILVNNDEIKIVNSEGANSLVERILEVIKESISSKK